MLRIAFSLFLFFSATQALAQGAQSPEQLVESYKTALAKKDVRSYMALVSLSREQDRGPVEAQFGGRVSGGGVISAKIVPFSTYEAQYKQAVSRGLTPTIEPKGWLVVEFSGTKLPSGATVKESDIMIFGLRNGRYFFGS
ncbi:hypothetical protein [Polaromonas sp. P5_D5]